MKSWVFLLFGSAIGGGSRYLLSGLTNKITGSGFPYGTMLVNLLGCFLIGILSWIAEEKVHLGHSGELLLIAGFCGAFTTFSTFMLDISKLMKSGEVVQAMAYGAGSFVLGYLFFVLGLQLVRAVYPF